MSYVDPPTFTSLVEVTDDELNALSIDIRYLKGDLVWQNATLIAPWQNYDSSHAPASFRRLGDFVYLRGLITGGLRNTDAFVLPVGYRPTYVEFFNPVVGQTPVPAGSDLQRVDISPDGTVHVMYEPISLTDYVSLTAVFTVV